jgi:glucosamine kinase
VNELVAGIDGGQSSTVAVVADDRGRILGRGTAGPADEVGVASDSTRLCDALRDALAAASHRANLPEGSRFAAIVAGISGYDGKARGRMPELPSERVLLVHDAPVAHAGALAGQPGVVVIAGTGSVVYARGTDGSSITLGGWGFLFGDEGSAFRIASDALAMLSRAQDEGDRSFAEEIRAAFEFFETDSLRQIVRAFYAREVTRDRLASFAPVAMRFERFRPIVNDGADRLAALTCKAIEAGFPAKVALTGGVFGSADFGERVRAGIRETVPQAEIATARYEPAGGALFLAYRELGIEVRDLH